ncbi:hypothetical protein SKAU_G00290130 [Synaphobranchus kaupii]|uniref:Uncharacterized protein n=1 Tax=Synaphobranchus kaupii TaxID=118154 RepID=A0A9Q1ETS1_SYNKA|nr:hypothetical protein SKAU_G00290130 [Synaphobranchus kaupii]
MGGLRVDRPDAMEMPRLDSLCVASRTDVCRANGCCSRAGSRTFDRCAAAKTRPRILKWLGPDCGCDTLQGRGQRRAAPSAAQPAA